MKSKSKRNKKVSSEKVLQKKVGQGVRKPNPFETHVLKSKFTVLNRDPAVGHSIRDTVKPGAIRARAIEKRKQTLGKEFATLHKANRFVDARKDGKNNRPQSNASRRKEMYNLNLTHRGQTLAELERFDDPVDNDDDEDEEDGLLDESFTNAAHFGGGSDEEGEDGGGRKDRKTVIEEMIANSKRQKVEKQRENDEVYEMMQKLDSSLKALMPQVGEHLRKDSDKPKLDDYDRMMREMIFERRGAPAEKLKSEEQARTEKQKRETLERERLERMKSEAAEGSNTAKNHRSADALDDGAYLADDVNGDEAQDNDEDDDGALEPQYDARNLSKEATDDDGDEADGDQSSDDSEEQNDGSSSEEEDNLSDLQNGQSSESEEEEEENVPIPPAVPSAKKQEITKDRKTVPEPAKINYDIPAFLEFPKDYDTFAELLTNRDIGYQAALVAKLVEKCNQNHPTSKANRRLLFVYLLQLITDRFSSPGAGAGSIENDFKALHSFTPFLYDLAQKDPHETGPLFVEVIQEKQSEYRKNPRRFPTLSTLAIVKLVPLLYSASDVRHSVVTPVLVFVSEMLTRCNVRTRRDLTHGLFLVTIVLECVEQSKRFLPAVHCFLTNILILAYPKDAQPVAKVNRFKLAPHSLALPSSSGNSDRNAEIKLLADDFQQTELTDDYKIRLMAATLGMISAVCKQLDQSEAIQTIAAGFKRHLEVLSKAPSLPVSVKKILKELLSKLTEQTKRPLKYLVAAEKKPKPLRMLEPKIETVYDDIRRRPKTAESLREQRKKMQQKIKRASRSAAREIRLDNEYISKLQMKRRLESDRERKEKVRRIFSDATSQQGELKSLDRKAKYRK
ncbi:nucleolar protein 14 homolog [Anopheles darlingi]|uniref:nucleolar protein 14 homolog n=1 Tax=Anopheles darlingi TaxID=43151 RepID=UPI00210023CE|nr:nucleolar protein 14 homolog [Anopheles darlingi]